MLALNADFQPLGMLTWKNAIKANWKWMENPSHGIEVVDFYTDEFIKCTNGRKTPVPAVGRVATYIRRKNKPKFSRKNIYIRDKLTCMYCGLVDPSLENLTLDHVISRDEWKKRGLRGSVTCWENIVTSCRPCNNKKANLRLKEIDLKLRYGYRPAAPSPAHYILGLAPWHKIEPEWEPYLTKKYKEIIELRRQAGLAENDENEENDDDDLDNFEL